LKLSGGEEDEESKPVILPVLIWDGGSDLFSFSTLLLLVGFSMSRAATIAWNIGWTVGHRTPGDVLQR